MGGRHQSVVGGANQSRDRQHFQRIAGPRLPLQPMITTDYTKPFSFTSQCNSAPRNVQPALVADGSLPCPLARRV